jgi:2-dehydropantoate 2-reductase
MVGGNPNALVLTLQNGVGNREEIEQTISEKGYKNRVWQGVTSNGAAMDGAGTVRHTGSGLTYLASPSLPCDVGFNSDIANLEPSTAEEYRALQALGAIFNDAGISSELSYDVDSLVWSKVVVNAAINPLSAVLGVPNGYLVKDDYSKNLMKKIIVEGMDVCKAKGIKLPYGEDTEEGFKYVANIAEQTSANYSSMLVDVIRGQPTEVKSINGVIVKEGERLDVNVAYNKMIMEMVLKCHSTGSKGGKMMVQRQNRAVKTARHKNSALQKQRKKV